MTVPGGIGGKLTLQRLREIDPNVKAIVSSGYSDDPVMAKYREYGAVDVVPKPYQMKELVKAVQKALIEKRQKVH